MICRAAFRTCLIVIFGLWGCAGALRVRADGSGANSQESASSEEEPEELKNWIELGFGGVAVDGDRAQFEQEHRSPGNQVFGGIEDLHYEQAIGSDAQLVLDGHAIFDTDDYKLRLNLSKQQLGYVEIGFEEFRSWYDGD